MTLDDPFRALPGSLAHVATTVLARHPDAVMTGLTAACVWGALRDALAPRPAQVELARDTSSRPIEGVLLRREHLEVGEVAVKDGIRLTTPVRTALDITRRLDTVDAVLVVEALVRSHDVSVEQVRAAAARHPHARGLCRARIALGHVEAEAASAFETTVRLALRWAGHPPPVVGFETRDEWSGERVAVADLAWPGLDGTPLRGDVHPRPRRRPEDGGGTRATGLGGAARRP